MHVLSSPLQILRKLLTQSDILPFSLTTSLLVFHSVSSNRYDLISQIVLRKFVSVILIVVHSVIVKVTPKVLSSVLLSLFINDLATFLPLIVQVSCGNDFPICASFLNVQRATSPVQTALNKLVEWSSKDRLSLSPLKM